MKKVIFLLLLMPLMVSGQVTENFESGNCNNWVQNVSGRWKADSISAITGRYSLHHIYDNIAAGNDRIALQVKNLHPDLGPALWSFTVRHGYDPSSTNNWAVFLMSEAGPESMSVSGTNGYAIGVNISGSDDTLRLVKLKNGAVATVVSTRLNWQTVIGKSVAAKISVGRTIEGQWTITVSKTSGETIKTASGKDTELFSHDWFGIMYRYTATADRLLWVDDISVAGDFRTDFAPPVLTGCMSKSKNSIRLIFNEPPSDETLKTGNIKLNDSYNPVSIVKNDPVTFTLTFGSMFENHKENSISMGKLCDAAGNCSEMQKYHFTPGWVETGDVVITEIMADPDPVVSLPQKEYIEITNRTGYNFNLKKWKLVTGSQIAEFPEAILGSKGIMIICAEADTAAFRKYGKVTGLKQFPSLTDEGRVLVITDSLKVFIHGVEYTSEWYTEKLKSDGGWSIEMVDSDYPFNPELNWKVSSAPKGGTPGSVNSVMGRNPDVRFDGLTNIFAQDENQLELVFSEPVKTSVNMLNEIRVDGIDLKEIAQTDQLYRVFSLQTRDTMEKGKVYSIHMAGLQDFSGNIISAPDFTFGIPEKAEYGDVKFNEILFNPLPGDPDFIEFYNCSGKIIDVSKLQLIVVSETSDTSDLFRLANDARCIMPYSYYAITIDRNKILERFTEADPEFVFQIKDLPSMPDDKGHLVLYNRELEKIDEVTYDEKMHSQLLRNVEGVALEKQSPEMESTATNGWHSAAESAGWGTPGAVNSVSSENIETSDLITFSSKRITPDSDGIDDILVITYNPGGTGNVFSATVYDESGSRVRKLTSNMLTNAEASLTWDATADDGSPVETGIYIILITTWDETGRTSSWKRVCAVIR